MLYAKSLLPEFSKDFNKSLLRICMYPNFSDPYLFAQVWVVSQGKQRAWLINSLPTMKNLFQIDSNQIPIWFQPVPNTSCPRLWKHYINVNYLMLWQNNAISICQMSKQKHVKDKNDLSLVKFSYRASYSTSFKSITYCSKQNFNASLQEE